MKKTREDLAEAGYLYAGRDHCRGCRSAIEWWITPRKKRLAFDAFFDGTLEIHSPGCPQAQELRWPRMGKTPGRRNRNL